MSAEASAWVFRHSPLRGTSFTIHVAIADSVNDQHDHELWMRQAVLARKARTTRGTVNTTLAKMVDGTDEYPPLLVLLETGKGGANRYRFLYPDLPVVHDTRARTGVSPTGTPLRGQRAPGCTESAQGGARTARTEPKGEPKGEPKPAPSAGHEVATEVWEKCSPKPAQPFVAVVQIANKLLDAGHPRDRVVAAMVAVPTISTGWVESWLNKNRTAAPARPVTGDRAAPAGRIR